MPFREVDSMPRCAACGILVPCQEIHKEHEGKNIIVCSEKCFNLYVTYWHPKYGSSQTGKSKPGR